MASQGSLTSGVCGCSGKVVVFTGLLKLLGSDDELAAVLAHEIAHVVARHAVRAIPPSAARRVQATHETSRVHGPEMFSLRPCVHLIHCGGKVLLHSVVCIWVHLMARPERCALLAVVRVERVTHHKCLGR